MARVGIARGNNVCSVYDIREGLVVFGVNPLVIKHLFKGKKSTIESPIEYFLATLPRN